MNMQSRRTIHTQPAELECGSVVELPSGKFACVMRRASGADAWELARVDVAKARLVNDSLMELSGQYLRGAKLAYSRPVWQQRCAAARRAEALHENGGDHG